MISLRDIMGIINKISISVYLVFSSLLFELKLAYNEMHRSYVFY